MRMLVLLLSLATFLAACGMGERVGKSKLNPRNWFGSSEEERVTVTEEAEPREPTYAERYGDPRPIIDEVLDVEIEAVPGGAVLRARGRAPMQGYWQPALLVYRDESTNDSLAFRFIAMPPPEDQPVGTPESREILAAQFLPADVLDGLRRITVIALNNRRTVSR